MTHRLKTADFIAAAASPLGAITFADLNHLAGVFGAVLGASYLIWKWRKETRRETNPPFPPTPVTPPKDPTP